MSAALLIEQGKNDDWESSEDDVEDLIDPLLIENLTRESRVKSEPELWHNEEHILIESVAN